MVLWKINTSTTMCQMPRKLENWAGGQRFIYSYVLINVNPQNISIEGTKAEHAYMNTPLPPIIDLHTPMRR